MSERIPSTLLRLVVTAALAVVSLAIGVSAASATEVAYDNLNTVATTVNGAVNQDTFSEAPFQQPFGGQVEFAATRGKVLKSVTTQVDSFTCESGTYVSNCVSRKRKFQYDMTANIYSVGPSGEPAALLASSTEVFKLPYRPSSNPACPNTSEGRGFGANCDVGGYLATVKFKQFFPVSAVLPARAIILVEDRADEPVGDVVNVGVQASYKEYAGGEFVEEPALDGGVPAVGGDPLPEDAYVSGTLTGGHAGLQPVFEVTTRR